MEIPDKFFIPETPMDRSVALDQMSKWNSVNFSLPITPPGCYTHVTEQTNALFLSFSFSEADPTCFTLTLFNVPHR